MRVRKTFAQEDEIDTLTDLSMREIGPKFDRNATSAASLPTPIRTTREASATLVASIKCQVPSR